jgi:hypothetical protein
MKVPLWMSGMLIEAAAISLIGEVVERVVRPRREQVKVLLPLD